MGKVKGDAGRGFWEESRAMFFSAVQIVSGLTAPLSFLSFAVS